MTRNGDFKKLVRARMLKTGESYMAARAQLKAPAEGPTPDEFAEIAGMSDERVRVQTGRTWQAWVELLDGEGAAGWPHKQIAGHLGEAFGLGPWWRQTVTVSYERIRGLRAKGQLSTGDFAASKSKTFAVPVARLYEAFGEAREAWMGHPTHVRTATPKRSVRMTWPDGTLVTAWFTDKGPDKSSVAIQHQGLPNAARREQEKQAWGKRLAELALRL